MSKSTNSVTWLALVCFLYRRYIILCLSSLISYFNSNAFTWVTILFYSMLFTGTANVRPFPATYLLSYYQEIHLFPRPQTPLGFHRQLLKMNKQSPNPIINIQYNQFHNQDNNGICITLNSITCCLINVNKSYLPDRRERSVTFCIKTTFVIFFEALNIFIWNKILHSPNLRKYCNKPDVNL